MLTNHTKRTAHDLLKDLSLYTRLPQSVQYKEKDTPRLVLQRVNSLLKAFDIGFTAEEVNDGMQGNPEETLFTTTERIAAYERLLKKLRHDYNFDQEHGNRNTTIYDFPDLYYVLNYHKKAYDLMHDTMGQSWEVPALAAYVAVPMTSEVVKKMREIDKMLALILDPEERVFTVEELVEKYDYPVPPPYDPDDDMMF